jgi:type I restriction enzyme S subunit
MSLQPYKKYYPVSYEYVQSLPDGWQLLPNIAVFRERKEKGTKNEELLSIVASRGVIKTSDYELKKDRSTDDKSEYLCKESGKKSTKAPERVK